MAYETAKRVAETVITQDTTAGKLVREDPVAFELERDGIPVEFKNEKPEFVWVHP